MVRRAGILFAAMLLLWPMLPAPAGADHRITRTSEGEDARTIDFGAGEWDNATNITIPSGAEIISGNLSVEGLPGQGTTGNPYPEDPGLAINGTWVWKFEGPGYGKLGLQEEFVLPPSNDTVSVGPESPTVLRVRLPFYANVTNASLVLGGSGILSPRLDVGADGSFEWSFDGSFASSTSITGLAQAMNQFLRMNAAGSPDAWGNQMTTVPLAISAAANGTLLVTGLAVLYEANLTVSNLTGALNAAVRSAPAGNVTVPLAFHASDGGHLRVFEINITYDRPPAVTLRAPLDGAVINSTAVQCGWSGSDADGDPLTYYFNLRGPGSNLSDVRLTDATYLASGLPPGNYTWWAVPNDGFLNGSCLSGEFTFEVVSQAAVPLVALLAPADGAVLPAGAVALRWTPFAPAAGEVVYSVFLDDVGGASFFSAVKGSSNATLLASNLTDGKTYFWTVRPSVVTGNLTTKGYCTSGVWRFSLEKAPPGVNLPPEIRSQPPASASAGYEYVYRLQAVDPEVGRLSYSLREHPPGMTVDFSTGTIRWTPLYNQTGNHPVTVVVSDGNATAVQSFTVNVTVPAQPAAPALSISSPGDGQKVNRSLFIVGMVTVAPGAPPVRGVQVKVGEAAWTAATLDNGSWSWLLDTSGYRNGAYRISARAYDGVNYSPTASVNLTFDNPSSVLLDYPLESDPPLWPFAAVVLLLAAAVPIASYLIIRKKYRE